MLSNSNDFEQVKNQVSLKDYARAKLQPASAGGDYVCPRCKSGDGASAGSDSAFSINGELFKCFSCDFSGDIFTLCAEVERTNTDRETLERVAEFAGYRLDGYDQKQPRGDIGFMQEGEPNGGGGVYSPSNKQGANNEQLEQNRAQALQQLKEYQHELFADNPKAQNAREYLASRGLTLDFARERGLGFNSAKNTLVIPYKGANYYYTQRRIKPIGNQYKYIKPKSKEIGKQPIYNKQAIAKYPCILVVEGEIDALTIEQTGDFKEVISLGGKNGINQVIEELKRYRDETGSAPITCLFFDFDEEGRKTQRETVQKMNKLCLPCYEVPAVTAGKDANEMYLNDEKFFSDELGARITQALYYKEKIEWEQTKNALAQLEINGLKNPYTTVKELETLENEYPNIATGFRHLDSLLWGGLEPFLYVLGATSSVGKTTLMLQIADNIARDGKPVLYVTIEQSAKELTAKSLSRLSYEILLREENKTTAQFDALKNYEIMHKDARKMNGKQWEKEKLFHSAVSIYNGGYAPNIHFFQPEKQPSLDMIRTVAQTIAKTYRETPVLFIDYLQLIAPQSDYESDKQAIDHNILDLRQMARDLHTPVFIISSLNRASYSGVVDFSAFKESGIIEYSADVLMGLQPYRLCDEVESASSEPQQKKTAKRVFKEFKREPVRQCALTLLKNRAGSVDETGIHLELDARYSRFTEV